MRAEDNATGKWTTPDAYAGDAHDPMSQKSFMWNNNNPYSYSDPSGYDPDVIHVGLPRSPVLVCSGPGLGPNLFFAPLTFSVGKIAEAGRAAGPNPIAVGSSVGHYGTFDVQRSVDSKGNTIIHDPFVKASNVAVGAYMSGAGYTKTGAGIVSDTFATLFSKNKGDPNQKAFRDFGYDTAAAGRELQCQKYTAPR